MGISRQPDDQMSVSSRILTLVLRILVMIAIPLIAFAVLYAGFLFLRDSNAPKWLIAAVAIVWGVGGVAALYYIFNWIVEQFSDTWKGRICPTSSWGRRSPSSPGICSCRWSEPFTSACLTEMDQNLANSLA